jgi:hypothetical protein
MEVAREAKCTDQIARQFGVAMEHAVRDYATEIQGKRRRHGPAQRRTRRVQSRTIGSG